MTEPDLGRIKGRAILDFLRWLRDEKGRAMLRVIQASLSPEHREDFDVDDESFGLAASEWYSARFVHDLIDTLVRQLPDADPNQVARAGGGAMIRKIIRGPQAIVFALLVSPSRYGSFVRKVGGLTYDSGKLEHRMLDDTSDEVTAVGWRGHHPFLCWVNTGVRIATFEVMGCRNVQLVRHDCTIGGENRCQSVLRWDA